MNDMKKILLLGLLAMTSLPVLAAPGGAERQQAFKKMMLSFEPMGMMMRGSTPYNKNAFIKQADALKLTAAQPFTLFAANSIDSHSRAKPEIWSQPAKFKSDQDNFLKAVNDLNGAAHSGDLNSIKKHYDVVAQSCKTCHDSFRGPKV
jgi:cytochrome c556